MEKIDRLLYNAQQALGRQSYTAVLSYILVILKHLAEAIKKIEKGGN